MAHTNSTENYGLPQWIGTDKPTFLGDFNTAFGTIDTQMKANSDAATTAVATANSADAVATSANTNATTALNTANSAATDAATAVSTASTANSTANTAKTNADAALRASAANTIENLAPAYDPTLTYNVGDLVTYIDEQNSGKLYKCIVAVNTPMEFNVNYWDDVTTSEVYARTAKVVASVTSDGVKTFTQLFGELWSAISGYTSDYLMKTDLIVETSDHSYATKYLGAMANSNGIYYQRVLNEAKGISSLCQLIGSTPKSTRCEIMSMDTTPTFTYEDLTSNVETAGYTWYIVER